MGARAVVVAGIRGKNPRSLPLVENDEVTVDWAADGTSIFGQVSLFNRARYRVSLARGYSGLWHTIRSGHLFDIEGRMARRLGGTSL